MSRTVFQNPQSCTCGGAPPKKFCQGLKTAPVAFGDTSAREGLTAADFFEIMLASTKEIAMQPEMTILMLVAVAFVAGIVGGLVLADAYDLEPHEKRRQKRRARMLQRRARNW